MHLDYDLLWTDRTFDTRERGEGGHYAGNESAGAHNDFILDLDGIPDPVAIWETAGCAGEEHKRKLGNGAVIGGKTVHQKPEE